GKLFANESLRKATCIHALCRSEVESIRAYGLKNPIALIPNGVELPSLISDHCPPTSGVKRQLLFLGRIHPKKGLSELLQGWAKVKSQKPKDFSNWQLLIAGWDDGNHLAGLKQLASQLGLSWSDEAPPSDPRYQTSDLCFLGPQFGNDKETLLRSVDGFILPSFSEGLPMSVLEAWSYGLPVMMTEFCNIPEGFEADAAIKIEPNVESITYGLALWMEMAEDDRMAMGGYGRLLVERNFTWKKIAQDMKTVYENCVFGK
ncbi:MAG: glycosyltransferase, partial [Methylococcales bacterium]|nr:glycosyltransferase [Methylococcales bacterium]